VRFQELPERLDRLIGEQRPGSSQYKTCEAGQAIEIRKTYTSTSSNG
jgi:hypothetical protein